MAENKDIGFKLEINGVEKSISSIKDLKGAIKDLQDVAENSDIGSEQYKQAIEDLEKLNDQLKEVTQTERQAAKAAEDLAKSHEEAAKETGDLRKQFEKLEDELFMLAGQGKENTEEFRKLSIEAATLNKRIDAVNQTLGGSSTERAEMGYAKLQESFKKLDFKGIAQGFSILKTAIAATGVMLLVQGVTYLYENFDKLSQGSGGLAKALRFVGDIITDILNVGEKMLNWITDTIGLTTELERTQESMGKKAIDSFTKSKEALGEQTAEMDRNIKVAKAMGKNTVEMEIEKQKAIIATNLQYLLQLQQMSKTRAITEEEVKLIKESSKAIKDAKSEISVIEANANKESKDKIKEVLDANLAMIKQIEDAKIAAIKNDEERAFAKEVLDNERRIKDIEHSKASAKIKYEALQQNAINYEVNLAKINEDFNAKRKVIEEKAIADKKEADEKAKELAEKELDKKNRDLTALAELNVLIKGNELNDLINQLTVKRDIELQNEDLTANEKKLIKEKYTQDVHKLEVDAEKKKQDEVVKIIDDSLKSAQNLSDIFFLYKKNKAQKGSAEELELAKKQFNVNKGLQLGLAIMDGYKAVTSSLSQSPVAIGPVPNPAGIASLAFAVTTSLANIAKIAASKFESGGGGGGGGGATAPTPSIPSPPTVNTPGANVEGTRFDQEGNKINNQQTPTIQVNATVGVDEISSKQNRVQVLENQSKF